MNEIAKYLGTFRGFAPHEFAVIDAGAEVGGDFAQAIKFLYDAGLRPLVNTSAPGECMKSLSRYAIKCARTEAAAEAAGCSANGAIPITDGKGLDLAKALKPAKYVLVTGVMPKTHFKATTVTARQAKEEGVRTGAKELLAAATAAESLTDTLVQITTPHGLLEELFTDAGNGIMVTAEYPIRLLEAAEIDFVKSRDVIEASFHRKLRVNYRPACSYAIVAGDYKAIAVVRKIKGMAYLDKLAVLPRLQGAGLAGRIWQALESNERAFFWRARPDNPINYWYKRKADGSQKEGEWIVYWKGMQADAARAASIAAAQPNSFQGPVANVLM